MAKFQFKLQPVLEYRETMEERVKVEYGEALAVLESIKDKITQVSLRIDELIEQSRKDVSDFIDPHKLKQYNDYRKYLKDEIERLTGALERQCVRVEEKRLEMVQAMTERKSVEIIKERHLEDFKEGQKKDEQKATDSIVSFRYATNMS